MTIHKQHTLASLLTRQYHALCVYQLCMSRHFCHTLDQFNTTWMEGRDDDINCMTRTKKSSLSTMLVSDDVGMFDRGDSCEEILWNKVGLVSLRRNKKRTSSSYDINPFTHWINQHPVELFSKYTEVSNKLEKNKTELNLCSSLLFQ